MEFVGYFFDRELRLTDLKNQLKYHTDQKQKHQEEQIKIKEKYNEVIPINF